MNPFATPQVLQRLAATFVLTFSISAVACLLSGAACGEPVFSFEGTPGKLPKSDVPIHYAIELKPDITSLALPAWKSSTSRCVRPPRG